ncbi:hypothetical protein UY3_07987 [Chelonia mydas]|uniref:Uncharacterized protein n=1 Tax=Chelonia mydas TaxID=8469 RepID=M7BGX1_CHEMY|nr:hypothetical protein UY3_07987 [Chelonia mydas]
MSWGGWALVQGKWGKRKARALLLPTNAQAPQKTSKGGTNAEPSTLPLGVFHPPVPAGEDVAAPERSAAPPLEFLPTEAPDGALSAPLTSGATVSPEASVTSGSGGENPRVVEGDLPSIYEEIKALGLTPVTQREDDPLLVDLDLRDLSPAPLSPYSLTLTVVSASAPKGPLGSSICPAAGGTPLTAAEPTEVGSQEHLPLCTEYRTIFCASKRNESDCTEGSPMRNST